MLNGFNGFKSNPSKGGIMILKDMYCFFSWRLVLPKTHRLPMFFPTVLCDKIWGGSIDISTPHIHGPQCCEAQSVIAGEYIAHYCPPQARMIVESPSGGDF